MATKDVIYYQCCSERFKSVSVVYTSAEVEADAAPEIDSALRKRLHQEVEIERSSPAIGNKNSDWEVELQLLYKGPIYRTKKRRGPGRNRGATMVIYNKKPFFVTSGIRLTDPQYKLVWRTKSG